MKKLTATLLALTTMVGWNVNAQNYLEPGQLPELPAFPEIPEPMPYNSVSLGDVNAFSEVKLDIPITEGPYQANWMSIENNYPGTPQWLRDAKFGIWVHFGPQSDGQSGDWYARRLYNENDGAYTNHKNRFGHPSEAGYKEVLHQWNPQALDPDYLTKLYQEAGARFLMIQGVHHDNFDLWDSKFQPWNSMNIGPKRDLLREWTNACHKYGMRYGVTFHHEYTWWWWQTAFGCDSKGAKKDVPYDGHLTLADGEGQWWEGYDPRMLYGIDLREYENIDECAHTPWTSPGGGIFHRHLDYCKWYATQWALRMMDVTANYSPDFIYTDGTVQGPFTGFGTGTGYKCNAMQTVIADYYNRQMRDNGQVDAFTIIKFRSPTNGTITTEEFDFPKGIRTDQDWIREAPIGDWFYSPGFVYDAPSVVRFVVEAASRDGNAALNVCLDPSGAIDPSCETMLKKVGEWMNLNGEAIYGSHAWKILGEGANGNINTLAGGALGYNQANQSFSIKDIRYTVGADAALYVICMVTAHKGDVITLSSLGYAQGNADGMVAKIEMLGCDDEVAFEQNFDELTFTVPAKPATFCPVFRLTIEEGVGNLTLEEVIADYEGKVAELLPLVSDNTGKISRSALNEFIQALDQARKQIGGDEESAILALADAFRLFMQAPYNEGCAPQTAGGTNVTKQFLVQANNFSRTPETDNGKRFGKPLNWEVDNFCIPQSNSDGTKEGIDNYSGSPSLMLGVWWDRQNSTGGDLSCARIYRKVILSPGLYHFSARYNTIYSLNNAFIFASSANSSTSDLPTESIAYWPINKASVGSGYMGIYFEVPVEQEVIIGFQADLTGDECQEFRADGVKLMRYDLPTGIESVECQPFSNITRYYTLQGIQLQSAPKSGIYIEQKGNKVKKVIK